MTSYCRRLPFFFGFIFSVSCCFSAEEKTKAVLAPSPYWAQLERALGSVNMAGVLRLSYPLGDVPALNALGLRCALEHTVETDAYGHAFTTWRFVGLRTSLVPTDRRHLKWQLFSGPPLSFEKEKIGRSLGEAGNRLWPIRAAAEHNYEIRAWDGRAWYYNKGRLTAMEHPALGVIQVITQGGLVREIRQTSVAADTPALVAAEYDERARLVKLSLARMGVHRFRWNTAGQLVSWVPPNGQETTFIYANRLLCSVVGGENDTRRYTWRENPGFKSGDSRWAYPVHLEADQLNDYTYTLTSSGFVSRRRNRTTHEETVTVFNPRRRRMEQTNGSSTVVVYLRAGIGVDRPGLKKITTAEGETLEEYLYDDKGELIGLKRKGEPNREFTRDDLGRLMAIDELPSSQ